MKQKQMQIYLETIRYVKHDKKMEYCKFYEYAVKNDKFEEFQKVAYAIKLMHQGVSLTAFTAMFINNPKALKFAGELVEIACKNQEHVL